MRSKNYVRNKPDSDPSRSRPRSKLSAIDRLVKLLAKRDHSRLELKEKLQKAEHSQDEILEALAFAEDRKWLKDDAELAARESARLSRAGKSRRQIEVWLKKKGLPLQRIQGPDDDFAGEELEAALKVTEKTWARLVRSAEKDHKKEPRRSKESYLKLRVSRLLMGRGFGTSTAQAVYARLLRENPLK